METMENTETITYQGEQIEAEKIGEIGGYMGTLRGRQRNGTDHLFRDAEGRYYLRKERFTASESGGHEWSSEAREAGTMFERTHAINVNAAILWAVNLLGLDAFDLRRDAAELLMEGRSYFDPQPVHLNPKRRAMVLDPDRFVREGSMGADADQQATPGRSVVELDEVASAMLRRVCQNGSSCREAGEDPRDLVNAAVTFYLCGEDDEQHGEFDLNCGDDALERAKQDRLGKEAA